MASFTAPQSTNQATANQDAFGKDAFMKLLVEQMRHQSPTDPSDGQAWINQMTQFSMLEQMQPLLHFAQKLLVDLPSRHEKRPHVGVEHRRRLFQRTLELVNCFGKETHLGKP